MRWPIVRGCVAMVETLSLAMKAFSVSASLAGETEEEQLSAKEISITMVLGAGLAIALLHRAAGRSHDLWLPHQGH